MSEDEKKPRLYTVEEANAILPEVREDIAALRDAVTAIEFAQEQLVDLRNMWGDEIEAEGCRDHAAYRSLLEDVRTGKEAVNELAERFEERGIEVKDPLLGLVDFYGEVDGEVVYLCWQEGEDAVRYWHGLQAGFGGRREL